MRNKAVLFTLAGLAIVTWAGLILFMNHKPANSWNQAIFLVIWGTAVSFTMIPVAYLINARMLRPLGEAAEMGRATRQGTLLGILATVLMALRFVRALDPLIGVVLLLVVVMLEVLFYLKDK